MSSVGETLRRERLRTGLDLDKIAQDTKISVRTLELIEANQFEKLPGGVFARSFVRQYARAVGVDEDEIVSELEKMLTPPPDPLPTMQEATRQPEIYVPRVTRWSSAGSGLPSNSSLPALGLVVLVIIACGAAYTWFQKSARAPAPMEAAQATKAPEAAPPAAAPAEQTPAEQTLAAQPAAAQETTVAVDGGGALHIALTA